MSTGHIAAVLRPTVQASDYSWVPLRNADEIRDFHRRRTKVSEVNVDGYNQNIFGWGETFEQAEEAWQYSDGCLLLAATIKEWVDTSHSYVEVRFFALYPPSFNPYK